MLKTVYDPEIPVDIYELGLIYGLEVTDDGEAHVTMTLTTPMCPVAESLPPEVMEAAQEAIPHSQQLVGSGAGDRYFDAGLEAAPEGPKISFHDRESPEPED